MKKRILLLLLVLLCLLPMAGFGEKLSEMLLSLTQTSTAPNHTLQISAKLEQYAPFGTERLEQLNRLLEHMELQLVCSSSRSEALLQVDGKTVLGMRQQKLSGKTQTLFSVQEDCLYESAAEETLPEVLNGQSALGLDESLSFMHLDCLEDALEWWYSLPELYPEGTKQSKVKTKIGSYGTATQKLILTFTKTAVAEGAMQKLTDACPEGTLREMLSSLVFSGRQQITLFFDADNQLLKFVWSGQAGKSEDALRKVTLNWKGKRNGDGEADELSLKLAAVKGSDQLTLKISRQETSTELTLTAEQSSTLQKQKTSRGAEIQLLLENGKLSGKLELSQKANDITRECVLIPDIAFTDLTQMQGTMDVQLLEDAVCQVQALLQCCVTPETSLEDWPEEQLSLLSVDGMTEAEQAQLWQQLQKKNASALVKALFKLPEEDLTYFSYDLPEEDWKSLLQLANETQQ